MRDHTQLIAFQKADALVFAVYHVTQQLPYDERFGLTSQMRRAAVSVASNIVEGCTRGTEADYVHFLGLAFSSLRELCYQLSVSFRLGYLPQTVYDPIQQQSDECSKVLGALIRSYRKNQKT